jgi:hypothetical protein
MSEAQSTITPYVDRAPGCRDRALGEAGVDDARHGLALFLRFTLTASRFHGSMIALLHTVSSLYGGIQ